MSGRREVLRQLCACVRGDYVRVSWFDASEVKAPLEEHKKPEILVEEWGIYLGVEGSPKHLLLGKTFIAKDRVWEATRIPLSLVRNIKIILKQVASKTTLRCYKVRDYAREIVIVRE